MSNLTSFDTPVLYLIFNRPAHTARSFAAIRERRPSRLFIAADGPRANVLTDTERTAQARAIALNVDWPCDLHTLFRPANLGSRAAIPDAITWFFRHVSEGIILEDDCLPNNSFFTFCSELLRHYRQTPEIASISGTKPLDKQSRYNNESAASYYFSRYSHTWGWATWRRAWLARPALPVTPRARRTLLESALWNARLQSPLSRLFWRRTIRKRVFSDLPNWDYYWQFSLWAQNLLSIIPSINLITNLGYGEDSTNTTWSGSPLARTPTHSLPERLTHPTNIVRSARADAYFERHYVIPHLIFGHTKRRLMSSLNPRPFLEPFFSRRHGR